VGTIKHLVAAVLGLSVAGCASAPAGQTADAGDPYEATNRKIFAFDQMLDRAFLLPTARRYNAIVPEFGRDRIHDLLVNLDLPITFSNDLLQGEPTRASQTLMRFMVNATVGVGGLFDPATHFKMPYHSEDFGQTLGVWGVGGDPYLMLPVLGPSSPRDTVGRVGDIAMDPLTWLEFKQHIWWMGGRQYMKVLDARARNIDTLEGLERDSVDFYATTRSAYRQYRANEIRNGRADTEDLPDF
jgi:phospholipid-binding lipoprotein MlaA